MKLKLTVDGKVYEVEVEVAEPEPPQPGYVPPSGPGRSATPGVPAAPTAGPAPSASVDEAKVCRSPISGVVVRVDAQVGQTVQPNDVLMVLEAMKMETVITAPRPGKVAKLSANPGDSVKGGQVLVEFE